MRDISYDFSEKVVKVSSLYSAQTYQEQDGAYEPGLFRVSSPKSLLKLLTNEKEVGWKWYQLICLALKLHKHEMF